MSQPQPPVGFSKKRLALAFAVAALADGLSMFLMFTPPLQWVADVVTAVVLFIVLGWHWVMLPGLILEAIPGINIFPLWLVVVAAIALLGTARPNPKALLHASQEVGKNLLGRLRGQPNQPPDLPDSNEVPAEIESSGQRNDATLLQSGHAHESPAAKSH